MKQMEEIVLIANKIDFACKVGRSLLNRLHLGDYMSLPHFVMRNSLFSFMSSLFVGSLSLSGPASCVFLPLACETGRFGSNLFKGKHVRPEKTVSCTSVPL